MITPGQPFTVNGGMLMHDTATFSPDELQLGRHIAEKIRPSLFRLQICTITPAAAFAWNPSGEDQVSWRNGTGFLVSPELIGTANHVGAGNEDALTIFSPLHGNLKGTVKASDKERDLALISISAVTAAGLTLRPADQPLQLGELCFAIGFPMAWQDYNQAPTLIVSPGRFTGTRPMNDGGVNFVSSVADDLSRDVYHFDMVAVDGHSGSPVVDTQGRLVGVFVASFAWYNKSFVQPVTEMHRA